MYLLYGADNYRSYQWLKQRQAAFALRDPAGLNQAAFDLGEDDWPTVKTGLLTVPFLAENRLVLIKNAFRAAPKKQEALAEFLPQIPRQTQAIFYEAGEADKRTKLFRRLSQLAELKEFPAAKGGELVRLIEEGVKGQGGAIAPEASQRLADYLLTSGWRLKNEIDKLLAYANGRTITAEDVELLVKPDFEMNIFNLTDALAAGRRPAAYRQLANMLERGANENYVLTMIIFQFRNLLLVKSLTEKSYYAPAQLAQKLAIHPFVARKCLEQSRRFSLTRLKKIYQHLLTADLAMKTGKMEPRVVLEILISGLR